MAYRWCTGRHYGVKLDSVAVDELYCKFCITIGGLCCCIKYKGCNGKPQQGKKLFHKKCLLVKGSTGFFLLMVDTTVFGFVACL
jgi:hypothetical protein